MGFGWLRGLKRRRERGERLASLVEAHVDYVARLLRNLGTPESEMDDAVQQVFVVVSQKLELLEPGAERSFLYSTAAHMALHARRTVARRREAPEQAAELRIDHVTAEQLVDEKRARAELDRILSELPDELRRVFVLYEIEQLTMIEIARVLELPQGTVASRLRRARLQFRELVACAEQRPERRAV